MREPLPSHWPTYFVSYSDGRGPVDADTIGKRINVLNEAKITEPSDTETRITVSSREMEPHLLGCVIGQIWNRPPIIRGDWRNSTSELHSEVEMFASIDFIEKLLEVASLERLIGLVMVGSGIAGLVWSSYKAWLGVFSSFWRKTDAEIIDVHVKQERDHDGDLVYVPLVHYRYNVDNVQYENVDGQFRIVETRGSKAWAEAATTPYSNRKRVPAYYNPWRHSQSVLEQGCSPVVLIVWVVALGTSLGGLLLLGVIRP